MVEDAAPPTDAPDDVAVEDAAPADGGADATTSDGGAAASCTASGGTVGMQRCCMATAEFPDTCGVGACSCAPSASRQIMVCMCPAGRCFNGTSCVAP